MLNLPLFWLPLHRFLLEASKEWVHMTTVLFHTTYDKRKFFRNTPPFMRKTRLLRLIRIEGTS